MKETTAAQLQRKFMDEYANTLDIRASALAAGYSKRTGVAVVRNILKTPKAQKELMALCERKAEHLEVCLGYIVAGYLKVLKWALSEDESGKPNDAALALRALDGIVKQLGSEFATTKAHPANQNAIEPVITKIEGLDTDKI